MALSVVYFRITHLLGRSHYVWDEYLYSVREKVEVGVVVSVTVCVVYYMYMYILLFIWFLIGDHCSYSSDDRFQLITAIFKSDGSDFLCTYYARGGQMLRPTRA